MSLVTGHVPFIFVPYAGTYMNEECAVSVVVPLLEGHLVDMVTLEVKRMWHVILQRRGKKTQELTTLQNILAFLVNSQ